MRTKDVLNNLSMSRVFYSIVDGMTTTIGISDILKVKPPAVSEQLERLRQIGVVRRREKQGKHQPYEIDLDGLSELFLTRSTARLHRVLADTTIYPKDEKLRKILGRPEYWEILTEGRDITREEMFPRFRSKLASNPLWKDYLFNYMKAYAILSPLRAFVQPILNAVNEFENSLRVEIGKMPPDIWEQIEGSKKDFLVLLHMWALLIQIVRPLSEGAHESAIREIVGWEIVDEMDR
jgi:DNA-binding transcriptional ArsR family regulator